MTARPRLTLDISPLLEAQWTGIPVFARRLAACLLADGRLDIDFAYHLTRVPGDLAEEALRCGTGAYLFDHLENRRSFEPQLISPEAPLLYSLSKAGLGGRLAREASVVHDLTTLFMPDTHEADNVAHHLDHFASDLASDEAIFCISEATRAALELAAPSLSRKTRLLPQYVDWPESFEAIDRNTPRPKLKPYAAVVGTLEPRKNLGLIARALERPELARLPLLFVVMGRPARAGDAALAELTPEQRQRLLFAGFVSEFVKYRLLRGAEFLIFPSLCEGFGIPALEAMSLGKPVLAARSGSLPEVVGDAGVYFDPFSLDEFVAALTEIAHPAKQAELSPRALARSRAFSPARMAAPVVDWAKAMG